MLNPGKILREKIENILRNDPLGNSITDLRFVNRADYVLNADGELSDIIYKSTINYITRRLITRATYLFKSKEEEYINIPGRFFTEFRQKLKEEFSFPKSELETLTTLIIESVKIKQQATRQNIKETVKKEAMNSSSNCYICGKSVIYNSAIKNHPDLAEVEHIWPHALGGSNAKENLKIACSECNRAKQTKIDSTDFHYETVAKSGFDKLLRYEQMAIWAKNDFKCAKCNKPASIVGPLKVGRIDRQSNWHYMNLAAYCSDHIVE